MPGKYTARKAIIMAAGFGKRLHPVTEKVPKPLVEVNGEKIVETMINGLVKNQIKEIYIVTGHLKEQFNYLPQKYSEIKLSLIVNPHYKTSNNISSLYAAREHLGDCIIADGDLLLYNDKILNPCFDASGYCSAWVEKTDSEWLQVTNEDGYVTSCSRTGGEKGWQLFSVSFWTERDGESLKRHLEEEFEINGNKDIYWDDIPMFCRKDEYQLKIREIGLSDIVEIDSLQDLINLDELYKKYTLEERK